MTATVDARGMRCPWPVLRLARAMRSTDEVIVLADDPAAPTEIAALAATHGWSVRHHNGSISVARDAAIRNDLPSGA